ncbi:MAG: hypothetical protein ACD_73C00408G0002 [uncultured bacterium]|nr:MAG: hypothetical protein ACD_73C00408G0002 [uncultured bacterium]
MKAIIIDDSRAIRVILRKILMGLGIEVLEAENGQDAIIKIAQNGVPEIALVDWNMPVMNGLDFVKAARVLENLKGMKIMMVTTEAEMDKMILALESGANEYVMKPFTKEVIIEKLSLLGVLDHDQNTSSHC